MAHRTKAAQPTAGGAAISAGAGKGKKRPAQGKPKEVAEARVEEEDEVEVGAEETRALNGSAVAKQKQQPASRSSKVAKTASRSAPAHPPASAANEGEDDDDDEDDDEDEEDEEEEEETKPAAKHPRLERSQKAKEAAAAAAAGNGARWTNRQRTLVFSSRGVSYRARHLLTDFRTLMPHSKKESKLDRKDHIGKVIPELCELRNCNNCIYFEMRKKQDLYLWIAKMPHGPSAKFFVENVHTMDELKLTGNCLKGSRPLLNFDSAFDSEPHYQLLKELLFQAFGTPNHHPKSKPFIDHVMSFFILDGRIWIRNYQIVWKESDKDLEEHRLTEIGPRCVLQPIRIFGGSFGGPTLFENPEYVSPNQSRANARRVEAGRYRQRAEAKAAVVERQHDLVLPPDELEGVFREGLGEGEA